MGSQIPNDVYVYVVSWLNDPSQIIPTVPQITGNTANTTNYLIKIKENNSSTVIQALILGAVPAISISPTKIVTTTDGTNNYVYVGGSSVTGGIYRVINNSTPNTVPYIAAASTNGIFDADEANKKLYYANDAGTSIIMHDLSAAALPDITVDTTYTSITEIKISPDGKKLIAAGTALIETVDTPIINIYTKDNLGTWQFTNRVTYLPNNTVPTNLVMEIVINKASTLAYAVNSVGTMVSSLELTGSFSKTDKLLTGYIPNSIGLKGTELYIADSSAPKVLKLSTADLSLLKIIQPPYTPNIVPNKLALTAYEDALYVSPFISTDTVGTTPQWRIDVIDPITGIDSRKSTCNVGLYNQSPIATFTIFSDNNISPTVPLPDGSLLDLNESVCIITTKVFSSCKEKDCFADVTTPALSGTAPYVLTKINFGKTVITNKVVTFIDDGNYLSRAEFDVTVPYIIIYTADDLMQLPIIGTLNMGHKDILMYIPETGNMNGEDYNLIAEIYTDILDGPKVVGNSFKFTVGVYEIFKITQTVQLFIPTFGYCPIPIDCTPYRPIPLVSICDKFLSSNLFPDDFYPKDYYYYITPIYPTDVGIRVIGTVAIGSIYIIIIEVIITRQVSGIKDYYYVTDEYDNSSSFTPLYIDKTYQVNIFPPKNPGDTQQVNLYGSYIG